MRKTSEGWHSRKVGRVIVDPNMWIGDPLAAWRGYVNGQPTPPFVLSNPARIDGLAIFDRADPDGEFTKDNARISHRLLAYTEGNNWPDGNGGAVPGSNILQIENRSGGGVLFAGSHSPGYEQPGAALTPVKNGHPGSFVPTPAFGWLQSVGLGSSSQPQVWVSVRDVDPSTVEGWHHSNARPGNSGSEADHGTPAFAYGIRVVDLGPGVLPQFSMSSSEGYDPALTGDPNYGMMLVQVDASGNRTVVAALTFDDVGSTSSTAVAWARQRAGLHAFVNGQGGVTVGGQLQNPSTARLVLAPRDEVLAYIRAHEGESETVTARSTHHSVAATV